MSKIKILLIVIVIGAVLTSIQTFHNYTMSKRGRFWSAIATLLVLILTLMITTMSLPAMFRDILTAILAIVCAGDLAYSFLHNRHMKADEPVFNRFCIPVGFEACLILKKNNLTRPSGYDVRKMKRFLGQIKPSHRQESLKQARNLIKECNNRQIRRLISNCNSFNVTYMIEHYWTQYKD